LFCQVLSVLFFCCCNRMFFNGARICKFCDYELSRDNFNRNERNSKQYFK
jgi:hypothetical protein